MQYKGLWAHYQTRRGAFGDTHLPATVEAAKRALHNPQYVWLQLKLDGELIGGMEYRATVESNQKEQRYWWLDNTAELAD